jgi:hypothetical protein
MHQDKTVTRILLIFLVTNVVLAAPAVVRWHLDVVATTSEKRRDSDDEATNNWAPVSPAVVALAPRDVFSAYVVVDWPGFGVKSRFCAPIDRRIVVALRVGGADARASVRLGGVGAFTRRLVSLFDGAAGLWFGFRRLRF